jgi:hypothetical protein
MAGGRLIADAAQSSPTRPISQSHLRPFARQVPIFEQSALSLHWNDWLHVHGDAKAIPTSPASTACAISRRSRIARHIFPAFGARSRYGERAWLLGSAKKNQLLGSAKKNFQEVLFPPRVHDTPEYNHKEKDKGGKSGDSNGASTLPHIVQSTTHAARDAGRSRRKAGMTRRLDDEALLLLDHPRVHSFFATRGRCTKKHW